MLHGIFGRSVSNLLVTLTAVCSGSVHVHKDHLKDSFFPFHPCVLPSVLLSLVLPTVLTAVHTARGWKVANYLSILRHFSLVGLFSGVLACSTWTVFCVWHCSSGLFPSSRVPQFPCLPGTDAAVERLSCTPAPPLLTTPWQHHVAVAYVLHGTRTSSDVKAPAYRAFRHISDVNKNIQHFFFFFASLRF